MNKIQYVRPFRVLSKLRNSVVDGLADFLWEAPHNQGLFRVSTHKDLTYRSDNSTSNLGTNIK